MNIICQSKGELSTEPALYQAKQLEQNQIHSSLKNTGASEPHNKNTPSAFHLVILVFAEESNAEIILDFFKVQG